MTIRREPRVEFDPHVVASAVGDRVDLLLRGRAVSAAAVDEIAFLDGDTPIATLLFGAVNDGGSVPLPEAPALRQYAFAVFVVRRLAELGDRLSLSTVITPRGLPPRRETVVLGIEHAGPVAARVIEGGTALLATYADVLPPLALYVERAEIDENGELALAGWAVSLHPIVTVQVFVGERRLGSAQMGLSREDVRVAFPQHLNAARSGFAFSAGLDPAEPPPSTVRVQVIALNGFSQDMLTPIRNPASQPAQTAGPGGTEPTIGLNCDEAVVYARGALAVSGWCLAQRGLVRIGVELDGAAVGAAEIGQPRPDVGRVFPDDPAAGNAGFRLDAQLDRQPAPGAVIALVAEDSLGRTRRVVHPLTFAEEDDGAGTGGSEVRAKLKFHLDSPATIDGVAAEPVTGHLTIEGWVVARAGVDGVDVLIDGDRLGSAYYGLARQDVGAAFPDWPSALRSGFAFHVPPSALKDGTREITLDVRARDGGSHRRSFRIDVRKSADGDAAAGIRRRVTRVEADAYARTIAALGASPVFDIVLRGAADADPAGLRATLQTLRHLVAAEWRLCGVQASLIEAEFPELIRRLAPIGVVQSNPDAALVLMLDPGDELGADALAELAIACATRPDADLFYSDEVRREAGGGRWEPFLKPDFSPELLLSTNYIGRLWCARRAVFARAGIAPDHADDYDMLLRCTEAARQIVHVPATLCRSAPPQVAAETQARAVQGAAGRRGISGTVVPGRLPGTWRIAAETGGLVSIIIPTCGAGGYIRTCIESIRARGSHRDVEIIVIDNIPGKDDATKRWVAANADTVIDIAEPFNWSRFNNRAAAVARGDYLLFLNDDVEIVQDDWLAPMLELARRDGVGAVGPQLLYPDRKVQHAGMFLARMGQARHAFRFADADEPGLFGLALTQRNVAAVTGACMMVPRRVFDALGGFDEAHEIINNDLDFCLRLGAAGLRVVYTPHASLIHHELASRAALPEEFDTSRFDRAWRGRFLAGDPYHGPGLSKHHDDYRPEEEPVLLVHGGHPLFGRDEIGRILALKVDHIGDFITALPALRRLRAAFPAAHITVLAGRAARSFAHLEPSIDDIIEFEFFHAKSGLGRKALDESDLAALHARLAPLRFDLAIDLRKHLDTRPLLRSTGARYLAGFDHLGQFPWLDISLEWEGDRGLHAKRYHISDDLLHLVDAVATAAEPDRGGLSPEPLARAAAALVLPARIRPLFSRSVVCVHAGAGNALKQWPPEYFATLIDLLLERDLSVLFIGGPDEVSVTDDVIARVQARVPASSKRVASLVGAWPLRDLPALLTSCALYVGNDSGPKHIAAAAGVPTVGIHSGTVDPNEWAPMGPGSVAVYRNMSCSPCYILSADRCPRALACLTGISPMAVFRVCERLLLAAKPRKPSPPRRTRGLAKTVGSAR